MRSYADKKGPSPAGAGENVKKAKKVRSPWATRLRTELCLALFRTKVCTVITCNVAHRIEHHYVPCVYLKNFADANGQVSAYRLLVAHPNVREWQSLSPRGIAYRAHLYTRMVSGAESDEIEDWFGREFEGPAEEAIDRATHDQSLTPAHWKTLIRFVAAQDVRTPARLMERMAEWPKSIPPLLDKVARESIAKLEEAKRCGVPVQTTRPAHSEYLPVRIRTEIRPGEEMGRLSVETVAGRGFWLFSLKHLLTRTLNVLLEHRWTIVKPYSDMCWLTSDDPVIKLNYNSPNDYNLKGGWGWKGTEIMLPLGPRHLLYTQVGRRPPARGWAFPYEHTHIVRTIIVEHAHRMIFAAQPCPDVSRMRPRIVDATAVRREREQWETWHDEQTRAERELKADHKH